MYKRENRHNNNHEHYLMKEADRHFDRATNPGKKRVDKEDAKRSGSIDNSPIFTTPRIRDPHDSTVETKDSSLPIQTAAPDATSTYINRLPTQIVVIEHNLRMENKNPVHNWITELPRLRQLVNEGKFHVEDNYHYFHATDECPPLKLKSSLLKDHLENEEKIYRLPKSCMVKKRGNQAALHRRRKHYFRDMIGWFTDKHPNNMDMRYWGIQIKQFHDIKKCCLYRRKSHPEDHLKFLMEYMSWNQKVTRFNVKVEAFTTLVAESDVYKIEMGSNYPWLPTVWTLKMYRKDRRPMKLEAHCTIYDSDDLRDFEESPLYSSKTIYENGAFIQQVSHSSMCGGVVGRWDVQIGL